MHNSLSLSALASGEQKVLNEVDPLVSLCSLFEQMSENQPRADGLIFICPKLLDLSSLLFRIDKYINLP